ncbi:hypothetical protein WMY93_006639 [Mugilogobius chulae]|uniref:Ig-like domain-containing protein n=1 Tax=Mugilogobius chulae TaxID=88201 RepID=A0AAW0PUL4_9GOBI
MEMTFLLFLLATVGLGSCYKGHDAPVLGKLLLYGPSVALVKKTVYFYCELEMHPENETVHYQLFKEGDRSKILGDDTSLHGEGRGIVILTKTFHDGILECVATVQNNTSVQPTVSNGHRFRVIEPVKTAEVEVTSGQTEFFEGKTLELQCKLEKGSYVTYEWFLDGQKITQTQYRYLDDKRLMVFRTTSKDSGSYMCAAQNSFNETIYRVNSSAVLITTKDVVSTPDISFTVLKRI